MSKEDILLRIDPWDSTNDRKKGYPFFYPLAPLQVILPGLVPLGI
jgi:hypothetical protein